MMGAPSLPAPQAAMPAGFAAFLANIGQVPDGSGEGAGFGQLLAATPLTAAPIAAAAALTQPSETTIVKADAMLAAEAEAGELPVDIAPDTVAVVVKPAATKSEPADAAALAATLLVALGGADPAQASKAGRPAATGTSPTPETTKADETPTAPAAANWAAIIAAVVPDIEGRAKPETAKPAATVAATPNMAPEALAADIPAAPAASRPTSAVIAVASADAPVTKTADTPSMTILFAQPAALTSAAPFDTSAPALIAERVLDMDSDSAWIDQLARDIAATKSDGGDVSFRLMPRHLGRLDVAMQMSDEGLSLKMDTHHEATATIVTAAQGRLVDELRQQGVRVAGAEVTCTPGETGRQSPGQGQGRAGTPDTTHLIETAAERAETRAAADSDERAADRRGRFA